MNETRAVLKWPYPRTLLAALALLLVCCGKAPAQECFVGSEIPGATLQAIEAAAKTYFNMSAQGDVAGLKANALPDVAANFDGVERAVVTNRQFLAQGQLLPSKVYLLDATSSKTTWARAEFYCGIYNSPDRVGLAIPNLPPGRYAMIISPVSGKDPVTLTMILAESGNNVWKLAGYYVRRNSIGGHDGQWFVAKAREYKEKGQAHNAWFYYLTAWDLMAPVDFISTPALDKLGDEVQAARPPDLPGSGPALDLMVGGKPVAVKELAVVTVNADLDLRVSYEAENAGNPALASQENAAVMKALLARYPELREAFAALIAHATDSTGHDYGTVTPMKDVK